MKSRISYSKEQREIIRDSPVLGLFTMDVIRPDGVRFTLQGYIDVKSSDYFTTQMTGMNEKTGAPPQFLSRGNPA